MDEHPIMIVGAGRQDGQRLKEHLLGQGYNVLDACERTDFLWSCKSCDPGLIIICDLGETSCNGLNTAKQIRNTDRSIPLILITCRSSESLVIAALKIGVNDYFTWPVNDEELLEGINKILTVSQRPSGSVEKPLHQEFPDNVLVGDSPAMESIRAFLPRVGCTDGTVLITGETGTGKECVAKQVHGYSLRGKKPLVCINCAAVPDSLLESELFGFERGAFTGANAAYCGKLRLANGGSIFFDEIGDMSPFAQAKILRVFEDNEITPLGAKKSTPVDIRIIAATNRDLKQLVAENKFREDLYYRIKVTSIHIPPLRDRKEDIPPLIDHYLKILSERSDANAFGFTNEALQCLFRYTWPGNVRELKNMLEALLVSQMRESVRPRDLPESMRDLFGPAGPSLSEKELLLSTLSSTNWNKSATARKLHWSRMTVYRKMQKYHIVPSRRRHEAVAAH